MEEAMIFLTALDELTAKGSGYRMHRESKPGVLAWLTGSILESNHPLVIDDYKASDWVVIQDDTVLR